MTLSRRLIGPSAMFSPAGEVADVDADGLLRRLLLFDQYILVSVRLQEFPHLIRRLGYEGLRDLMFANLLEVRCECFQIAEMGQTGMFGSMIQPYYSYWFNWIDAHDRSKYIDDGIKHLKSASSLRSWQRRVIEDEIREAIRPLPEDARRQLWPQFREQVENIPLLKASIRMVLDKHLGRSDYPFDLSVRDEGDGVIRVESNLAHLAGVSEQRGHELIKLGLMGIAGLAQVIGEMEAYSALCGFREGELPLFRQKLGYLSRVANSDEKERQFQRVIELADLPPFSTETDIVDVERFLKIRESKELCEFRDWLEVCGSATDSEIRERVAGVRAKVGARVAATPGKALRFLATTAIGSVTPIGGLLVGLVDTFLLERLLPSSGIAAFVNELYPSLFEKRV